MIKIDGKRNADDEGQAKIQSFLICTDKYDDTQ